MHKLLSKIFTKTPNEGLHFMGFMLTALSTICLFLVLIGLGSLFIMWQIPAGSDVWMAIRIGIVSGICFSTGTWMLNNYQSRSRWD